MKDADRSSWWQAEPDLLAREQQAMAELAPEMVWLAEPVSGGWGGKPPSWVAERAEPNGLTNLLGAQRLELEILYTEGFPMVPPRLVPLHPEIPLDQRFNHAWHVNGDGTLCLLRNTSLWTGTETAADLVAKAVGWFVEYRLMEEDRITQMTESGIYADETIDAKIEEFA